MILFFPPNLIIIGSSFSIIYEKQRRLKELKWETITQVRFELRSAYLQHFFFISQTDFFHDITLFFSMAQAWPRGKNHSLCWGSSPPIKDSHRASLVAQLVRNPPAVQETWVWSLGQEDPLVKEMATHSSILAWTEEPDGLQSMGLQRVRHDWLSTAQHI